MREIHVNDVTDAVRDLAIRANTDLGHDVLPVVVVNGTYQGGLYNEGVKAYAR